MSRRRRLPNRSASVAGLVRLDLRAELEEPLTRVGQDELRLLDRDPRSHVAGLDVQLRALDVVLRLHERRRVLFVNELPLTRDLLDFRFRLLQLGLLLEDRPLERRAVELHDDVAGLHGRAVLGELHNLQLAGVQRRRQHDRFERTDFAADFERVDELAARDLRRGKIRQRSAARLHVHADDADRREDARDTTSRGTSATATTG